MGCSESISVCSALSLMSDRMDRTEQVRQLHLPTVVLKSSLRKGPFCLGGGLNPLTGFYEIPRNFMNRNLFHIGGHPRFSAGTAHVLRGYPEGES